MSKIAAIPTTENAVENILEDKLFETHTNSRRRDLFFELAAHYELDDKSRELIHGCIESKSELWHSIKSHINKAPLCVNINVNLGDRINFFMLFIAKTVETGYKEATVVLQDDSISDFLIEKINAPIRINYIKATMDKNDPYTVMLPLLHGNIFVIDWWGLPLHAPKNRRQCARLFKEGKGWEDFMSRYRRAGGKWDMLSTMYDVGRSALRNISFKHSGKKHKNINRKVLISPVANTLGRVHKDRVIEIIKKAVSELKMKGFQVYENIKPSEEGRRLFNDVEPVLIDATDIMEIQNRFGHAITLRSGLSDALFLSDINLHVIYPAAPAGVEALFAGWSPVKDRNPVTEHIINMHPDADIVKTIVYQVTDARTNPKTT